MSTFPAQRSDPSVAAWPAGWLHEVAARDDLHIAPFRPDGKTPGTPTWIWSVVVAGELYVRAYNGTQSSWYRAAEAQRAGRITVAGRDVKVRFATVPADADIQPAIDAAYRAKYNDSAYLPPMISARARQATVHITRA